MCADAVLRMPQTNRCFMMCTKSKLSHLGPAHLLHILAAFFTRSFFGLGAFLCIDDALVVFLIKFFGCSFVHEYNIYMDGCVSFFCFWARARAAFFWVCSAVPARLEHARGGPSPHTSTHTALCQTLILPLCC
jgi:hypothetical protein